MIRDRLILLQPNFLDPAFPGKRFYCWHCALMEGLLQNFPDMAARIDIERVAWTRPRNRVVELLGEENQSLPVLILADRGYVKSVAMSDKGHFFINDKDAILAALSDRYGIPVPHP